MWNFFSRDTSRDFPYDITDTYHLASGSFVSLSKAVRKTDKEIVSIFTYEKKTGNNDGYEVTKTNLRRLKTLRHPSIVTYLDSYESEDCLYIVTEYVESLLPYLEKLKNVEVNEMYIPWGIMSILKAVSFLNNDGKLRHNNLSAAAVFVTEAGEWKLAELGYVTDLSLGYPSKDIASHKYDPPEITKSRTVSSTSPWAVDSWGLGILMWEVYNGKIIDSQNLKKLHNIPSSLKPIYCEMVAAKPEKRPNMSDVLQRYSQHGEYFSNVLIKTLTFLDEIHLKNKEDVNIFFKDLLPLLDKIPKKVSQHKVLPQIVRAYEFGNDGACMVPPFLKISESIEEPYYQKIIVPFIIKLFSSNDRATRSILLQHLEQYIDKITPVTINDKLFPMVVNGFIDTNPRIREQTVKAMVDMVPKLSRKNIDDEVLRHLARLQSKDDQGGIRTNTTVCLGKIAYCLNPSNRSAVLISAFLRSLSDPFPPVRNAGILAFAVCQQYFSLEDVGKKILPVLCGLTLDPDISVRENTFKTIKGYLGKLEKVSENPALKEEMEKEALSSKSNAVGTWAEWAVTAIASKFSSKSSDAKYSNQDAIQKETSSSLEPQLPIGHRNSLNETKAQESGISYSSDLRNDIGNEGSTNDEVSSVEESGWDNESWLSLSDHEDVIVDKSKLNFSKKQETDSNPKKVRSGPMKLGTRISQQKFE